MVLSNNGLVQALGGDSLLQIIGVPLGECPTDEEQVLSDFTMIGGSDVGLFWFDDGEIKRFPLDESVWETQKYRVVHREVGAGSWTPGVEKEYVTEPFTMIQTGLTTGKAHDLKIQSYQNGVYDWVDYVVGFWVRL